MSQSFRADLSQALKNIKGRDRVLVRTVGRVLFNEMSSGGRHSPGTPIDTGFARRQWSAAIGQRAPGGEGSVEAVVETMEVGDTAYIENDAPYVRRLEHGFVGTDAMGRYYAGFGPKSVNGRSSQAPEGFVGPAAAAIQAITDEVVAHLQGA